MCNARKDARGFLSFFSNTRRQKRSSAPSPVFSLRLLLFTLETLPTLKNVFSFFRVCVCVYLFGHWVVREARQNKKQLGGRRKKKRGNEFGDWQSDANDELASNAGVKEM
ncbi:Uncharacterized protein APZ42_011638 [Daphnia magna]|uniref:Uncharacterized protein n=1 Tax=Daphnia magna TaxID=35525 RepID=A0A162SV73_9CRUS|nr:Uncharacterized protein APZ42_011638 [Daphnia magna]